jgi:hypothetical protein
MEEVSEVSNRKGRNYLFKVTSDRFESVNENMTRTTSVLDNKNSSLERHRHRLT